MSLKVKTLRKNNAVKLHYFEWPAGPLVAFRRTSFCLPSSMTCTNNFLMNSWPQSLALSLTKYNMIITLPIRAISMCVRVQLYCYCLLPQKNFCGLLLSFFMFKVSKTKQRL